MHTSPELSALCTQSWLKFSFFFQQTEQTTASSYASSLAIYLAATGRYTTTCGPTVTKQLHLPGMGIEESEKASSR